MPEFRVIALLRKLLVIVNDRRLPFDVRCAKVKWEVDKVMTELRADDQALHERDVIEPRREDDGDRIYA